MPLATPQTSIKPRRPQRVGALWWFVLLSLALHLWLLWTWQPQELVAATSPATPMGVRLVAVTEQPIQQRSHDKAHQTSPPPAPRAEPAAHSPADDGISEQGTEVAAAGSRPPAASATRSSVAPAREDAEATSAAMAKAEPSKAQPVQTAEKASNSAEPLTDTDTAQRHGQTREHAETHIRLELARHFSYPLLARKRGWQGEVLLAFHLAADGRIRDARIARSSGHGVLDRAALKALDRVAPLKHNAPAGITLKIPVIYRLEG